MFGHESGGMDHSHTHTQSDISLVAIQKARKQVELDAQVLANRIALLKQEELKSWKKIEETKKKAREVYIQKKRHEERLEEVSNAGFHRNNKLFRKNKGSN